MSARVSRIAAAVVAPLVAGALLFGGTLAAAQEPSDAARELATKHAPIFMLKVQSEECATDGEMYEPTSVDIVLDNPQIVLRQLGPSGPVIEVGPTAASISDVGEGFNLDYPGEALQPGCIYQRDFEKYAEGLPNVVYAHVTSQPEYPDKLALQYWTFWYFNDWNNLHEGDWEFIQLVFDAASPDQALGQDPSSVGYAQHEGGERASWDSAKLERVGDRPVVYSSSGSHASYYGSALYLGRRSSEGFGCDNTDGPSRIVDPEVVVLPTEVDDPTSEFAWLNYEGRWGQRGEGAFNGPTGPAQKQRWTEPIDWQNDLRRSSVVVPTGDSQAAGAVEFFCDSVEWGSGLLVGVKTSPVRVAVTIAVVVAVVAWLVRRTVWEPNDPMPLQTPRRTGQILSAALRLYREHPGRLFLLGLLYIPASGLFSGLTAILTRLGPLGTVIDLAGERSATATALVLLVGSTGDLLAFTLVTTLVAALLGDIDAGRRASARAAYRALRQRLGALLVGFLVVLAASVVLGATVIGLPIAIYLLVRWQFLPQMVAIGGERGGAALSASYRLVARNWFRVAWLVLIVTAIVVALAIGASLAVLVTARSMPLWAFDLTSSLIFAFVVPFASAAITLLHGDLTARARQHTPDRAAA